MTTLTEKEILALFNCRDCEEFCEKYFLGSGKEEQLKVIVVNDDTEEYSGPCFAIFQIEDQLYKVTWRYVSHWGNDYFMSRICPVEARNVTTVVYENVRV